MSEEKYTIHDAIIDVMKSVGQVEMKESKKLGYAYISYPDLIRVLRPTMLENGIHVYVEQIEDFRQDNFSTKSGTLMNRSTVLGRVIFFHAPSQTSITIQATGEGMDTADKSCNKSMTGMLKYALLQTFMIESGDEQQSTSEELKAKNGKGNDKPTVRGSWSKEFIEKAQEWLIEDMIIPSPRDEKERSNFPYHIRALLELSPFVEPVSREDLRAWGKQYRVFRDMDEKPKVAANKATEIFQQQKEEALPF
jgi:hypothetical protein